MVDVSPSVKDEEFFFCFVIRFSVVSKLSTLNIIYVSPNSYVDCYKSTIYRPVYTETLVTDYCLGLLDCSA